MWIFSFLVAIIDYSFWSFSLQKVNYNIITLMHPKGPYCERITVFYFILFFGGHEEIILGLLSSDRERETKGKVTEFMRACKTQLIQWNTKFLTFYKQISDKNRASYSLFFTLTKNRKMKNLHTYMKRKSDMIIIYRVSKWNCANDMKEKVIKVSLRWTTIMVPK